MNGKTILIIAGATAIIGAGAYAGSQLIDWNTEGDKMAQEIEDKNFWKDEQAKMEEGVAAKANGENIDWEAEGDKMAFELSDESALAQYNKIDWNKELDIMADDIKAKNYSGTWEQIATYMNGELQDHSKATLILSKGQYESRTSCMVTGSLNVAGDVITMKVGSDGCTGGKVQGSFSYNYQISKDGKILTLDFSQGGFSMREVFKRVK